MKARAATASILIWVAAALTLSSSTSPPASVAGRPDLPRTGDLASEIAKPDSEVPTMPPVDPSPTAVIGSATIYAETEQQVEMADSAMERFAAAGLELPPVTIHMYSSRAHCSSYPEYIRNAYYIQVDGEHIIHSCDNEWTLLHEFGHVWDSVNLDDTVRDRILEHQGLDSWRHDTWGMAGAEHLASIIAWGIEGTYPHRIGEYDRAHLAEAYAIATGTRAPVDSDSPS